MENKKKPELPLGLQLPVTGFQDTRRKTLDTEHPTLDTIHGARLGIGPKPEGTERLFEGSSQVAREFFENDIKRLKESLHIQRMEPRLTLDIRTQNPRPETQIDLRTGKADVAQLLPKHVQTKDPRIPDHPGKTLDAAMKKLNIRKAEG